MDSKITVLSFGGADIYKNRGNYFNLNEKIYKRYHTFKDLQFVVLSPLGTEAEVKIIQRELGAFTEMSFAFVFIISG